MDHIGIDVHKRESQIYILAEGGEVIEQRIRTEPERFAAGARSHVKQQGLRGTDRPRPFLVGQPLGAPLMRRYFRAHAATPYLCFRRLDEKRKIRPGFSSPGDSELGPLRLVRYPAGSGRGLPFVSGPLCPPAPQAPRPLSREADGLRARVLMDEGWMHCSEAMRAGDKIGR